MCSQNHEYPADLDTSNEQNSDDFNYSEMEDEVSEFVVVSGSNRQRKLKR